MGGGSNSSTKSNTNASSSKRYSTTTTSNPYVTSTTNNRGTTTKFQDGSALSTVNNFTNNNIDRLLNEYLNPSIDTTQNQALLGQYQKNLESETNKSLQNNIIAPLTRRNMIRSSQATDLYNNLSKNNNDAISDYTAQLLSNSQNNTENTLNTLMNYIFQTGNLFNSNQALSLNTSSGNATTNTKSNTSGRQNSAQYGL